MEEAFFKIDPFNQIAGSLFISKLMTPAGEKDNSLVPYREIEKTLCIARKGWDTKTSDEGQIYIYKKFINNNAQIWLYFLSHNVMPSSHSRDITQSQAQLLYLLIQKKLVKLQDIIFASIKEVAMHGRKGVKMMFLDLISDLFKKAKIASSSQSLQKAHNTKPGNKEMAEAELYTLKGTSPPYFTEPYSASPTDFPGSSRRGKEAMVISDIEDDDDEMAEGDSEDF
ncbi:hypothetical protein G2W53_007995 [Senna tora]|uniref:Putative plant transposon protein domain-containing protein n=1 Tax=Senna tora TaxID=362788 RepID=A0A834X6A8_9FABA|nr:hypothetical protein G2W53_007995 [Senna tora]